MTIEEKIEKTIESIKQTIFGRVDDFWLDSLKQVMEVALSAEEKEQESRTCDNCKWYEKYHPVGNCALFDQDMPCTGCNEFERKEGN